MEWVIAACFFAVFFAMLAACVQALKQDGLSE